LIASVQCGEISCCLVSLAAGQWMSHTRSSYNEAAHWSETGMVSWI
jgi:hypothetical protein